MCDFCENGKPLIDTRGSEKRDTFLYVKKFLGKWYIDYTGIGAQKSVAEISYCPLCGRKLSEEAKKPPIDEIIAKLKENLTEDEQKKLNESIKEFSNGLSGLWEVVRKGIENGEKN